MYEYYMGLEAIRLCDSAAYFLHQVREGDQFWREEEDVTALLAAIEVRYGSYITDLRQASPPHTCGTTGELDLIGK